MPIQMKAPEQYFPVVLFIMLHKGVPTFESVDEILNCVNAIKQYFPVVLFIMPSIQGGQLLSLWMKLYSVSDHLKGKRHGDLVFFQNPKNVFGLTETVK